MDDERVPIEALMRADVPQQWPRIRWQRIHGRNLGILAAWLAGEPLDAIAARHDVLPQNVRIIVRNHAMLRFRRVAPRRPKSANRPMFWDNVRKVPGGCWEWTGVIVYGYGKWRNRGAHRVALETYLGRQLRRDEFACHSCDNPPCVRPDHLYVGDALKNLQDARDRGRLKGFTDYFRGD